MARRKSVLTLLAVVMLSGVALLGIAASAQAALRHIEGTVVSKNANARTFKVTTQGGSKVTIRVNGNTAFQRIAGKFSGLHAGMAIEVEAQSTSTGLLAKHVEPRESGGGRADDPPNHG